MMRQRGNELVSRTVDIGLQRFEFSDAWRVYKMDDERDLLTLKRGVSGTKDADIVGILRGRDLYLMEVTDLRGHQIENRNKLRHGKMVQEFCQKIRDTIPALVGAFHTADHEDQWTAFMEKLADRSRKIRVVLWMEQDPPRGRAERKRRKSEMSVLIKDVKKHLKWLAPRVLVESQYTYENDLGFTVTNLPGAGQN